MLCVKTTFEKGDFSKANSAEFDLDAQILEAGGKRAREDTLDWQKGVRLMDVIEIYLNHALECLAEGDSTEAMKYIQDALAEIKRHKEE